MLYLAPVFLIVIAYIIGELFSGLFKYKEAILAEKCLLGTFLLAIFFEGFVLLAIKEEIPFKALCIAFSVLLLVIIALCVIFVSKRIYKNLEIKDPIDMGPIAMVVSIFAVQCICFFVFMPDAASDYTVELVNTTLYSNEIYTLNPGTGEVLQGMTFRGKIVSLPVFYAYISTLFGGNVSCLIYRAIPIWSLTLNFICYGLWAIYLFKNDERRQIKVAIFLTSLGVLNICGMFSKNCIFYNQMFKGFNGETICFSVIIPYCIYCALYMISNKVNNKWINILLALVCSIALTDYQKGFVPTIIVVLICCSIHLVNRIRRWIKNASNN